MRSNGIIQLAPLARILFAMAIGIWLGSKTEGTVTTGIWGGCGIIMCIAAYFIKGPKTVSSLILLISVALGGLTFSVDKQLSTVSLPSDRLEYKSVICSKISEKKKVVYCDIVITEANGKLLKEPFKVKATFLKDTVRGFWKKLKPGTGIRHYSILKEPDNYSNVSHFNYRRWMKCHGYKAVSFIGKDKWTFCNACCDNLSATERIRIKLLMKIDSFWHKNLLPLEKAGKEYKDGIAIIAAMTLGDKSMISNKVKEDFSSAGASHILALSGLHLGIIYWILTLFLGKRNKRNIIIQTVILLIIWTYVLMVGMPVSIIRAATMLTIYSLMGMINRDRMSLNTLAFTAIIMLIANPLSLWDTGFQLSFMATASILTVHKNIIFMITPRTTLGNWIWANISIALSAQIGTAPLVAYYFGQIPCYFILVNLVVIPMASAIIFLSIIAWGVTTLSVSFNILFYGVSELAQAMYAFIIWVNGLNGATINNISINTWQIVMYYQLYIIVLFVINRKKFR